MLDDLYIPRPEYPRPDHQRAFIHGGDWLNLNGPWQFRFDGNRKGLDERWYSTDEPDWREQIIVPFCWESLAAWGEGTAAGNENYFATRIFRNPLEVNKSNHRTADRFEVGWYRRRIQIPQNDHWRNKRVILHIGAADFFTDCWCNGKHLGRHEGGYDPFEFDITDSLQAIGNGDLQALIVVRVEDPMDHHEQPVGKQWRWYTTVSGIWQTVYIEPRSVSYIDCFRINPDINSSTAKFEIECVNLFGPHTIRLRISPPEGPSYDWDLPIENTMAQGIVDIRPLHLWDPNSPMLYGLSLHLQREGRDVDVLHSYFGMRKLSAVPIDQAEAPGALCLNNEPIYLRGALYQSFFPDGVYTAGTAQMIRDDIARAKRAGFDFLRVHIKLDDPLLLYYADTLGILLMTDLPNFGEGGDTPLGRHRYEEMLRAAIKRDYNHPSIIAWCLFNETWGFGGQAEFVKLFTAASAKPAEQEETLLPPAAVPGKLQNQSAHVWVQSIWELAKLLDPTRMIEDMSVVVWEHLHYYGHGHTDINSWHFYIHDYEKAKAHIEKIVSETFVGSTLHCVEGFKQGAQPLITSEYGGIGALDGDRDISWSFKFLTNELRLHSKLSAYIYTELHDVEWEYNGILNYDRTPKDFGFDPTIINSGDVLPIDAPPISLCAPSAAIHVKVFSSHYSRRPRKNVRFCWRLHGIDSLGQIHQDIAFGSKPIDFPHGRVVHAHTIPLRMPERPMLCTLYVEAVGEDGMSIARNFAHYFISSGALPIREEQPGSVILRGNILEWDKAEWSKYCGKRDEAEANGSCFGQGHGFFEWELPIQKKELESAKRLRVMSEVSSRRFDTPQTDVYTYPTEVQIYLNGIPIYKSIIPNHPHDSRGCLSYLRNNRGAYGYLTYSVIEGSLLQEISAAMSGPSLRLRLAVPEGAIARGGLTVYGPESGRYPLGPTVIVEW